jgi:hypothetical protein
VDPRISEKYKTKNPQKKKKKKKKMMMIMMMIQELSKAEKME